MIELKDISFGYGKERVIDGLTLSVEAGSVTGIIGPCGSGKTTLLRLAAGMHRPGTGEIRFCGRDIRKIRRRAYARKVALLTPEEARMPQTVFDAVLAGRGPHRRPGFPYSREDRQVAWQALEWAGCERLAAVEMELLAAGERRRVLLAAALAGDTAAVLLDEPTAGLDTQDSLEVMGLVRRLNRDWGKTVMAAFHDLPMALEYAHELVVLDRGGIAAKDRPGSIVEGGHLEAVFHIDARKITEDGRCYRMECV